MGKGYRRNNGQGVERNEYYRNDYFISPKKEDGRAEDRTSDLLLSSPIPFILCTKIGPYTIWHWSAQQNASLVACRRAKV